MNIPNVNHPRPRYHSMLTEFTGLETAVRMMKLTDTTLKTQVTAVTLLYTV